MRIVFALLRAIAGIAIIAAIIAQLSTSISFWLGSGVTDLTTQITNYFSFFTIDSNALAAIVLLIGAVILVTSRGADPKWFTLVRASVVTYMVVTGIVYNLLLRGIELPQGVTVQWSNEILHVIAPIYLLLDWLLAPGRSPLRGGAVLKILIFPLVWVAYTMLRAPVTEDPIRHQAYWYPYPFLDPHNSAEGFLSVAFYIVLIAAVIGLVAAGIAWISRRRRIGARTR
ncbi:Pr6Pr family membrane protein [Rathayibacter soli]|uniref:Pr6Pr family membrane protein n=1 Tax=Rathayibacter soli TaxID=3144168 RepID=UPI0027E47DFF|nr:Pr6Pr family membrane protein [Glaciibacter superstes]